MKALWKEYQPRTRFRTVQAFIWQPDLDTSAILPHGVLSPTTFYKDFREPLQTYEGPGALLKTARGTVWVIPGDVVILRGDNTCDVMKPGEFFATWEETQR